MIPATGCSTIEAMELSDLAKLSLDSIHDAFVDAFSDYVIPFDISRDQLAEMLRRRGYDPTVSVGAVDDGQLAAFTLNGVGTFRGVPTAYDTGTGVRRSHRGMHLTQAMFELAVEILPSRGVVQYLLEVITTNSKASAIYQSLGFEVVRELQCWMLKYDAGTRRPGTIEPKIRSELDWTLVETFGEILPSWQNSTESILRSGEPKTFLTAEREGRCVGYAVVYPATGDVPQLAVSPEWRRRGIGSALVDAAARLSHSRSLRMINVDDRSTDVRAFLERLGARPFIRQYEMLRPIAK